MATTRLQEILDVVRAQGETGSHHEPRWESTVDGLGRQLDDAVYEMLGDRTLSNLLDEAESKATKRSATGDGHTVDEK
jgi:hypothetical protein